MSMATEQTDHIGTQMGSCFERLVNAIYELWHDDDVFGDNSAEGTAAGTTSGSTASSEHSESDSELGSEGPEGLVDDWLVITAPTPLTVVE